MKTLLTLLFFAFSTSHLAAHHRHIIDAFAAALGEKNFTDIKSVFTEAAWQGADKGISANTLQRYLKENPKRHYVHMSGAEHLKPELAMGIKFYPKAGQTEPPSWVYIHLTPLDQPIKVTIRGKTHACRWRIERLTSSAAETQEFMGQPLDFLEKRLPKMNNK